MYSKITIHNITGSEFTECSKQNVHGLCAICMTKVIHVQDLLLLFSLPFLKVFD